MNKQSQTSVKHSGTFCTHEAIHLIVTVIMPPVSLHMTAEWQKNVPLWSGTNQTGWMTSFLLSPQVNLPWLLCLRSYPPRPLWDIHTLPKHPWNFHRHTLLTFGCVYEGWQPPIWMAMLLGREEEEQTKSWGEDSNTEKWLSTVRESWAVEWCRSDDQRNWRGYDNTRYRSFGHYLDVPNKNGNWV